LNFAGPNKKAGESPVFIEILHRHDPAHEFSGCVMMIFALAWLVCAIGWSRPVAAQEEKPLIMPSEHKLPTKKDLGPRAIAVLQLSSKGKASLVPLAIMIDGKFWDASAYKADPVPMALEYGTVYEVERTGSSQGLFTVGSALRSNAVNSQTPWLGTGAWVPAGTEEKKNDTVAKASGVPVGMSDSDAPPRLTRDTSANAPSQTPASSSPPSSSKSGSAGGSSDGPPRLSKPASEPSSNPNSTTTDSKNSGSGQTGSPQSGSGQNSPNPSGTPSPSKPDNAKANQAEQVPVDDSGADASGRPRLRHGKPAVSFADEDIPGYSRPGAAPSPKPASTGSAKTPSAPEPVEVMAAISDAHGPEPHSYGFEWLKGEEEQRHDQMVELAKQQLAAYLKAAAKEQITPETHPSHVLQRTTAKKPKTPEPVFENAKMVAYDLWLTNQPVLIFTADAHTPSNPGSQTGPYSNLTYSITIAAYPDIYNNLHKLYVGITDKYHLDVTPKLELIDAVDADGDGRGELLFRETSDAGTGWVIYRASADSLWKMYDSLNPQ
jgi:hypothetical protein